MLNVDRLLKELQFVTANPDKHYQDVWAQARTEVAVPEGTDPWETDIPAPRPSACGSFGCLAGNTAVHEPGVELDWYKEDYEIWDGKKIQLWQADQILNETVTVQDWCNGGTFEEKKSIKTKAQELLGLTSHQAELLFDGDNTLDQLWELAERFSGGEIIADKHDKWSTRSYGFALTLREDTK